LVDSAGRLLVGTDDRWRIFPRYELGLARGWLPLTGGVPVYCWGYPPMGRWGRLRPGPLKPLLDERRELSRATVPAASSLPLPPALPVATGRPLGSPVLYDWGREVTGYLSLEVAPAQQLGVALLFTGDRPPDPLRSDPSGSILIVPGRHEWMDVRPRRLRYAVILGLERPASLSVLPVLSVHIAADTIAPPVARGEKGVFGIVPPPLRTPVEDEVWGKLQRLSGITGRKEL
jgi:hypothetical protein